MLCIVPQLVFKIVSIPVHANAMTLPEMAVNRVVMLACKQAPVMYQNIHRCFQVLQT
jgi:hypothetical protein